MRMFGRMLIGRTITAQCNAAGLASAQVHPGTVDFYTFLANRDVLRMDVLYLIFMSADFLWHWIFMWADILINSL